MKKIPFSPLPPKLMDRLAKRVMILGNALSKMMPTLKLDLFQANINLKPKEYASYGFITAVFYAFLIFFVLFFLGIVSKINLAFLSIVLGMVFFLFMLFSSLLYPRIVARRRMRKVEENLVPALRHLLIEIRSGVPLFYSMNAISEGYGEVSNEFKEIVRRINTGMKEIDALTEATKRNPSFQFRRALWQISNALKSGADIGNALKAIVDDLTRDQVVRIRAYGKQLSPWTMIYMVAAVIMPSLGITFLVIISSFSGAVIPKFIFPLILVGLVGFQFFFMNFVKSKRPPI